MNAYEIARAEATRVVEAAYHKAVAAGELPEGSIPPVAVETPKDSTRIVKIGQRKGDAAMEVFIELV